MKTRSSSARAEPSIVPDAPDAQAPVADEADASPTAEPTPKGPSESEGSGDEPRSPDPLDHDGDGRKGGATPAPERQPLVVLRDDPGRGLIAGEVVTVAPADAAALLMDDVCRNATDQDVDLAAPRIRPWSPAI